MSDYGCGVCAKLLCQSTACQTISSRGISLFVLNMHAYHFASKNFSRLEDRFEVNTQQIILFRASMHLLTFTNSYLATFVYNTCSVPVEYFDKT